MSVAISIKSTEDAVPAIAALATRVIAADDHPGHSLEEVGERMTTDDVLDAIRCSYDRNRAKGMTVREAFTATGQSLVAHYCDRAGIPTRES
ncbi:hypothetical protein [Streptomyces sp. NPDC088847]|uniref:hypothetical protein n=1 Tax=Streptomyces sp. NPDC088847 TaxID=3365909 RepID=UPI003819E3DC